jgi:hypothetical protein
VVEWMTKEQQNQAAVGCTGSREGQRCQKRRR